MTDTLSVPIGLLVPEQSLNRAPVTVKRDLSDAQYSISMLSPTTANEGYWISEPPRTIDVYYQAIRILSGQAEVHVAGLGGIMRRIKQLSALRPGWLDDDSVPLSSLLLAWLEANATALAKFEDSIAIVPLGDGGVAIHMRRFDVEYTAELHDDELYMVSDNTVTDELNDASTYLSFHALERFLALGVMA